MHENEKTEEFGWMNKIAQKMLQHKKGIVALFAVLAVLCALLSRKVKVDYNMGPVDKKRSGLKVVAFNPDFQQR